MLVSVIIPVRNGAYTLDKCLKSIKNQTIAEIEVIVLDSMSTDNSKEISLRFGAKVIDIADGTFNHGLTRNIGAQMASGKYLFYTVQDAWLSENDLINNMVRHFIDEEVMGVVGHQAVPHDKDKNPALWYRPYSKPEVIERLLTNDKPFTELSQTNQQSLIAWDNVVSMYRKSALIELPFVKTELAEDWIWSHQALLKGWKLFYDPSLIVYHYHHKSYGYAFNLEYTNNYHFYKFFGYKPSVPSIIKPGTQIIYHLLRNKKLSLKEKLYWIKYNCVEKMAKYFSTLNFLARLKINGQKAIERGYFKYCKTIPQGSQKS